MVNKWLESVREWLLPSTCVLCGARGRPRTDLCAGCDDDLPFLQTACQCCALPMPVSGICGHCQKQQPVYDKAVALFEYAPPVDYLVQQLKFSAKLYNARLLGGKLAQLLEDINVERPELIMPVPLHVSRLRERGFNQALEIARPVSRRLRIPLDNESCVRVRSTEPQSGLKAKARQQNLRQAFSIVRPLTVRSVAIVDDVMTTGCTVAALAQALKATGVERVDVWLCARAGYSR